MPSNPEEKMLDESAEVIKQGGVVIAPTEGVYGFSCAFDNEAAIERILQIKGRAAAKGLITACSSVQQALSLIDSDKVPDKTLSLMHQLWPGPHTFVLPCRECYQGLLTGFRPTIALRVSGFKLLHELCAKAGKPLVSTSVNLSGRAPISSIEEAKEQFEGQVDYIITAPCQGLSGPTSIYDGLTGQVLRQGGS